MIRIIIGFFLVFLWGCTPPVQQEYAASAPLSSGDGPAPSPTPSSTPAAPTGSFLYVLSASDTTVYAFSILSDGNLSLVQTLGVQANATILSISSDHNTLYSFAFSQILQYAIASDGTLTNTTPGYSQSIFTAEAAGADFSGAVTSETVAGVTYSVAGTALSQSVPATNYSVGADPAALTLK